jgi:catechol 2,3-dioxygenase-like lactoylglutathione lyase family enzyme
MGLNHIAIEVGDIDEALAFYAQIFEFKLRGKSKDSAFIDLGDQFLALQKGRRQPPDATSVLLSTTKRPSAERWPRLALSLCLASSWTFAIRGAIASK